MRKIIFIFFTAVVVNVMNSPLLLAKSIDKNELKDSKSFEVTLRIVISEDGKEIQSNVYNFHLINGEEGFYENKFSTPYWAKQEDASPNYIEEKINMTVKPNFVGDKSMIHSKVEGCLNTHNSIKNDYSAPNMSCFSYSGTGIIEGDQFIKIFDGKIGASQTSNLDIFIKAIKE